MEKIKTWIIRILLALVALLAVILKGRKPEWVKEKEKEVEQKDELIKKEKIQAKQAENYYKEMIKKHDEEIEQAGKTPGIPDINNPNDAANYIDDILSNDGS
ncbi:hypothetical protein [Halocella sp. SP3-1]|uniref:hypothetical protein n=1 Tax=Halocella sp. SP3-1 TaxID=2382161 RepID=UPI000F75704A|nr:hypothetical protein [Halocella sp. SP3-1]AZO95293.1 hypothetical protein D7D81_12200 [Halocella sp. SP3-1]